jgi:Bacterial inner membrane protein
MGHYTEYIGYAASFFVLASFVMKKMFTLRLVNIIGCGFFIWYGIMLESIPIIVTNVAIVLVNVFFLIRMKLESNQA